MAKPNDYEFEDDFEFDESFDFEDEGSFNGPPISKGRKVVTALTGSFTDGVKNTLYSEHFQEETIGKLLPESYSDGFSQLMNVKDNVDKVHRTISDGLGKEVNKFKKDNQKAIKSVANKIPGKMGTKLAQWSENYNNSDFPAYDQEKAQTELMLSDVFGAANKVANDYQTTAALEGVAESKKQTNLTGSTNQLLFGIGTNIGKMVGYQDNISIKYQRKMLELSFKQLTVQRKHLDTSEKLLGIQTKANEVLVKNTALPDMLKVHNSELLGRNLKEQFIGSVTAPMFTNTRDLTNRIGEKVNTKLKSSFEQGGAISDLLGSVLNHFGEEEDDMFGQGSNAEKIAAILGGQLGGTILPKMIDALAPGTSQRLAQNGNVVRGGKILENLNLRAAGLAQNAFVNGNTGIGAVDKFSKFFGLSDLQNEKSDRIQHSTENNLDSVQAFDVLAKRTLTDVIPGLLGRIHTEMRRFNGDTAEGNIKYDWKMGGFTQDYEQDARLVRGLVEGSNIEVFNQAESEMLKLIDPDEKLSSSTRGKIARQMSIAAMTNQPLSLQNFLEIEEFAKFMDTEYDTRSSGSWDSSLKTDIDFITTNASDKFLERDNQFQRELVRLKNTGTDPLLALIERAKQGDISTLRRYPFVVRDEAGKYTIDYDAYYDYANAQLREHKPIFNPLVEVDWSSREGRETRNINNLLNRDPGSTGEPIPVLVDYSTRNRLANLNSVVKSKTATASVWVKGEASPRLDALSMRLGKYISLDTGEIIKSLEDITGDIIDSTGEVLLTRTHLEEGLVDREGNELKGGWSNRLGEAMALGGTLRSMFKTKINTKTFSDITKNTGIKSNTFRSKLTGWAAEKEQDKALAVGNLDQNVKQTAALATMGTVLKQIQEQGNKTFNTNDKDKDGDRDGSWIDILQRRREKRAKDAGNTKVIEKDKEEKKEGFFDKLMGFIPSLFPLVGGMFSKAFGFAMPALSGLLGSAIKIAIPAALGALGLKWLANKWLNREGAPEMIAPDDPRLDPQSPMYDPELEVTEPGFGDQIATKVKDMGLVPSLIAGYAAWRGGKYLLGKGAMALGRGAVGAGKWGVNRLLGRGTAAGAGGAARGGIQSAVATARLNAALIARGASRGGVAGGVGVAARLGGTAAAAAAAGLGATAAAGATSRVGLGTAAKLVGKTLLRGFMGPIGWAWLAYDVISFGISMYKKHVDDGKKLNRLRIAQYGYHHTDKEHVQKILALEGELVKHVTMKGKSAALKDTITVDQVMQYFNVTQADKESADAWNTYFFGRFLPVFLSYVTAMQALAQRSDIFEMDIVLDPSQQLRVCDETLFTREQDCPYDLVESGFAGEDKLEMTREKVMDTYKLIRGGLESKAKKTEGTYTKASDVKDEKTRAKRADELAVINAAAIEGRKPWDPRAALDSGIDKVSESVFGTGMMGNIMSTVAKSAMMPQRLALGVGNWLWDKATGGGSGVVGGTPPNFTGAPSKGWTPAVAAAVKWGAEQLGINPNYLASVISFETGGTFSPNARNPGSSGTGLIQFMDYADGKKDKMYYGMTRDQFGALSVGEQMKYVVSYFKGKGLKAGASLGAIYDAVTGTGYKKGSAAYESNKVWDANKDGVISPGESITSGAFKAHMKDFFGTASAAGQAASGNGASAPAPAGTPSATPPAPVSPAPANNKYTGNSIMGFNVNEVTKANIARVAGTTQPISPGTGPLAPNNAGTSVQSGTVAAMNMSFPGTSTGQAPSVISVSSDAPAYKAAMYAKSKGLSSSSGYCARYVRVALEKGGNYPITPQNSAYQYHTNGTLANAGFVQIQANTKWQIGDVMVFQNNSAHVYGHIQIFHGTGWVSDFIQSSWKPYRAHCPPFSLWRDRTILNGAAAGSGWTAPDGANVGGADGASIDVGNTTFGGSTGKKWVQKRAIRGGDALWGANKKTSSANATDAKPDKAVKGLNAGAVDAKPDTAVVKSKAAASEQKAADGAKGAEIEAKKTAAAVKAMATSVKSTDAVKNAQPAAKQTQETVKIQEEIQRKEKDQRAKQQVTQTARESETSILKQQLQIQSDTLNEIRGLRNDIQIYAKGSIGETRALKDIIKTAQPVSGGIPEQSMKSDISPVQAPDNILEPISLLKS